MRQHDNTTDLNFGYFPRVCAVCDKKFEATSQYVFKRYFGRGKMEYYCSYSCSRKAEEERKRKKESRKTAAAI